MVHRGDGGMESLVSTILLGPLFLQQLFSHGHIAEPMLEIQKCELTHERD